MRGKRVARAADSFRARRVEENRRLSSKGEADSKEESSSAGIRRVKAILE
ncbi:MAG TPA: hypothetical protein VFP35_02545 [Candidatus Saccharimonadales bacterium]|nr:hypothetical protein [Candidatus Saccharimonadales bacterium]